MANNSIDLVSLDFDSNLSSFRNYLRDNDQFKDYDYEGSNLKLLLELFALNSAKTGFYQNMVLNESFLDSAVLRNSALSKSKELNYLPTSSKSSRARVKITFDASGENAPYIVPKGSQLTTLVKNDSYTFTIADTITVSSANNSYEFETDIYEGFFVSDTYTFLPGVDSNVQRFEIKNKDVDLDSLTVTVYEDGNEVGDIFTYSDTLLDIDGNSRVFFLQPSEHGYYEVLFGNGFLGRVPKGNATVVLNYRISTGEESNGARLFTVDFDPTGTDELTSTPVVNTLQESRDGADPETLQSIKFMAPRHFQVQQRAVIDSDYKVLLKKEFPEINAINAYGGEELSPPRYGKVFCAVDIKDVEGLPDSKKAAYANFLKNRTTFGIIPVFIDPEFVYLQINSLVRYNINVTNTSENSLETFIRDAITSFKEENLDDFGVILRKSRLDCVIDESDPSIVSTITDIRSYKKITPTLATFQSFNLGFGASFRCDFSHRDDIHPASKISTIESSPFIFNSEQAIIDDNGSGILRIMKATGDIHEKIADIGTVDYDNGIITITDLKVDSYFGSSIRLYARMKDPDISASLNNILTIEDSEINLDLKPLRV